MSALAKNKHAQKAAKEGLNFAKDALMSEEGGDVEGLGEKLSLAAIWEITASNGLDRPMTSRV